MRRGRVFGALVLVAAIGCWELTAVAVSDPFLPTPTEVLHRARELWIDAAAPGDPAGAGLRHHVLPSLARAASAWTAAVVVGVLAGVWLGRSRILPWIDPALQMARALPPPLLVPIFLSLLPLGTPVQLTVIFTGCLWPVLVAAIDGSREVDPLLVETAKVNGVRPIRLTLGVVLPAAAGRVAGGVRVSVSLALVLMVVSEMVAATEGIGFQLVDAARTFDGAGLWATVLLLGVLGNTFNTLLLGAERIFLPWVHRTGSRR